MLKKRRIIDMLHNMKKLESTSVVFNRKKGNKTDNKTQKTSNNTDYFDNPLSRPRPTMHLVRISRCEIYKKGTLRHQRLEERFKKESES